MSLINDALKRAKAAQETAPPSALSASHLRPVEPKRTAQHAAGLLLPIVLTLVALGGLFFLWQASQANGPDTAVSPIHHSASSAHPGTAGQPAAAAVAAAVGPRPAAPDARTAEPVTLAAQPTPAITAPTASATAAAAAVPAAPTPAPAATPTGPTNILTLAQAVVPPAAALRLQAIVYTPTRPSAMVNGKTVFVGDRIGEFRVLAISHDSATLGAPTRTNVLSLAE